MVTFFRDIKEDLLTVTWRQTLFIVFCVFAIYGMLLFNPVTAYDFNSAKGDSFQVFLTYVFMHRISQAIVAGIFHDFTPSWTITVGLFLLFFTGVLLIVLFRRLGFSVAKSLLGVALWFSTPFFFNRSIYQHALPAETFAFCCDVLAMLSFERIRRCRRFNRTLFIGAVLLCVISTSVYQAHLTLLLTGFMGITMLDWGKDCRTLIREWTFMAIIIGASVFVWFMVNHGPMLLVKIFGVVIPESGGAHDTIYWVTGGRSFLSNVKALFVGFVLNWVYNAFFVVGLRCVLLSFFFCLTLSLVCGIKREWNHSLSIIGFVFSVFVLPIIQCNFANLRTFYCLIPLIVFTGMLILKFSTRKSFVSLGVLIICTMGMAHETATLYYYNWKVKEHDKLHMSIVAHDLWGKYGLRIERPVAIIGGWQHYPTCWEDLRPFRQLPLINHPFTSYSNVTCVNVPREFYMVAREKVGLLIPMPDLQTYAVLRSDKELLSHPAYPKPGYIFEHHDLIVVNLGKYNSQWGTFRYEDYSSPNEKLLRHTLGMDKIDRFLIRISKYFRDLAERYPWTVTVDI